MKIENIIWFYKDTDIDSIILDNYALGELTYLNDTTIKELCDKFEKKKIKLIITYLYGPQYAVNYARRYINPNLIKDVIIDGADRTVLIFKSKRKNYGKHDAIETHTNYNVFMNKYGYLLPIKSSI